MAPQAAGAQGVRQLVPRVPGHPALPCLLRTAHPPSQGAKGNGQHPVLINPFPKEGLGQDLITKENMSHTEADTSKALTEADMLTGHLTTGEGSPLSK